MREAGASGRKLVREASDGVVGLRGGGEKVMEGELQARVKETTPLKSSESGEGGESVRRREIRGWSWTLEVIRRRRERCWEIRRGVEAVSILTLRVILAVAKRVTLKRAS